MIKILHNNRCSKSRCALEILKENGFDYEVVSYLEDVPSEEELTIIIEKLGILAEELVRKGEKDYKDNFKGKKLTEKEWISAMIKYPKLIERPIVINGNKAVVGRPPESILNIL